MVDSKRPSSMPADGSGRAAFRFDASRFPLIRITVPAMPDPADVPGIYRQYDEHLTRGRHVLLVDMRALNPIFGGALARRATLREVEARDDIFERQLIAEARLVSGSVVRGIVTAFEWMRKRSLSFPILVTESEEEAKRWLRDKLDAERDAGRLPPR